MTVDAVGGVWTYGLELAAGLSARSTEVMLAAMGPPPSAEQRRAAAAAGVTELCQGAYPLEWMDDPWAGVDTAGDWLLELEAQFAPHVVHLNGYAHGALGWKAPAVVVGHSCVWSWWWAVHGHQPPPSWQR
ncbi:MAG: glycosyltransferase [Acidimicrobiia bacterium]|nr:glycosyltransferase [Acidimicrobiia bacterium]